MIDSAQHQIVRPPRRRRSAALAASVAGAAGVLGASLAAVAIAATTVTIGSASNAKLSEQVAVNSQGRTLYALSPETASHLLCKSHECFKFWPPVTVPSRSARLKAGAGVHGKLGILRRSNGVLQVTLRGMPLYRFAGDHAKGEATGQGVESFGGTWHAVTAGSTSSSSTPAPSMPAPSAPSTPGYGY